MNPYKYDPETRRTIVEEYMSAKRGECEAVAQKYDLSAGTIRLWAKDMGMTRSRVSKDGKYRGSGGERGKPSKYTAEQRRAIAEEYAGAGAPGNTARDICERYGVTRRTIRRWMIRTGTGNPRGKTPSRKSGDDKTLPRKRGRKSASELAAESNGPNR